MFQQPMTEFAIRADMEERKRQSMSEPDPVDSIRWFHQPKSFRPSWLRRMIGHLGHLLVFIGHQLEYDAAPSTPESPQQLEYVDPFC